MVRPHPVQRTSSRTALLVGSGRHRLLQRNLSRLNRLRTSPNFLVGVVAYAIFVDLFLYAVLVPVFPFSLRQRIHVEQDRVQTVVSQLLAAYALGSILPGPPIGWLSDRSPGGRRWIYTIGLVFLLLATIGLFYSQSVALLILARILQGVSSATVWTVGLSLISSAVDSEKMGRTMGIIGATVSCAELIGPIVGGTVYKVSGERGVFYICFAMLILDILLRLSLGPAPTEKKESEEEALLQDHSEQSKLPRIVQLAMQPRILTAILVGFIQACILSGPFDAVLPLHLEAIFSFDAFTGGTMFAAIAVPEMIIGPLSGWWMDKKGPRVVALAGLFLVMPLQIALAIPHGPANAGQIALMTVILVANGVACSLIASPGNTEISLYLDTLSGAERYRTQAYSLYSAAYSLGCLAGPLLAGILSERVGWGWMVAFWALAAALCIPPTWAYMGRGNVDTNGD